MPSTLGHFTGVFNRGADRAEARQKLLSQYSANRRVQQIALYAAFVRLVSPSE